MTRFEGSSPPPFPPTLHDEIGLAHVRVRELASKDRELHFSRATTGRVVVELRTLGGQLLGRIPSAVALEIIYGADLDEALRVASAGRCAPPPPPATA